MTWQTMGSLVGPIGVTGATGGTGGLGATGPTGGVGATGATGTANTGTLAGDVTGPATTTVVEKLRGRAISATAPTSQQVYAWDTSTSSWVPRSGDVTLGYSTSWPIFCRWIDAGWGARVPRGITNFGSSYVGYPVYALMTDGTIWRTLQGGPPNNWNTTWSHQTALDGHGVDFSAGYNGFYESATASTVPYLKDIIFFNRTTTALRLQVSGTSTPPVESVSAITLAGLPSGFEITAMWAVANTTTRAGVIYVIINNQLWRSDLNNANGTLPNPVLFYQVSNTSVNAITTKSRLHAMPSTISGETMHHFCVLYGTAPNNRVAYYDSQANAWTDFTTTAAHNGTANHVCVNSTGRVWSLNPSTRVVQTRDRGATAWETRYTVPTSNRRMLINQLNSTQPWYVPSANASSLDVEVYGGRSTVATNVQFGPQANGTFQFPADYPCNMSSYFIPSRTNDSAFLCNIMSSYQSQCVVFGDNTSAMLRTSMSGLYLVSANWNNAWTLQDAWPPGMGGSFFNFVEANWQANSTTTYASRTTWRGSTTGGPAGHI
jgi:hypothetical protein